MPDRSKKCPSSSALVSRNICNASKARGLSQIPAPPTTSKLLNRLDFWATICFTPARIWWRVAFAYSVAGPGQVDMHFKHWLSLLFVAICAFATEPTTEEEIGLRVGERAPAFKLPDQNGREVSLDELLQTGPVALVFFRSTAWCIYCDFQLIELQQHLKEIEVDGARVVGISYDATKVLKRFSTQRSISIQLLSDLNSATIDAYNARDRIVAPAKKKEGAAGHIIFVVDKTGVIRSKLFRVINDDPADLQALKEALNDAQCVNGGTSP